jgi:hypothetical protein
MAEKKLSEKEMKKTQGGLNVAESTVVAEQAAAIEPVVGSQPTAGSIVPPVVARKPTGV